MIHASLIEFIHDQTFACVPLYNELGIKNLISDIVVQQHIEETFVVPCTGWYPNDNRSHPFR